MADEFGFFGSAIKLKREEKVGVLCNDLVKYYKGLLVKKEFEYDILIETAKESIKKMNRAVERKKIYKEENREMALEIKFRDENKVQEKKKIITKVTNKWADTVASLEDKLDKCKKIFMCETWALEE